MPVIFLLGVGSGWLIWGQNGTAPSADSAVTINDNVKRVEVKDDGDPVMGPDTAPITIVEFSDYQCPFCVKWYSEVYARLIETYKGKIRFIYRDFPLYSIHPNAESAAEAAECAGEQKAYYLFHDALFSQKFDLGTDGYTQYATELGLDVASFTKCISEHRYKNEIAADYKYGSSIGVSSTPTFFINGLQIMGAQPYEVFQQIIDKELAGEINK